MGLRVALRRCGGIDTASTGLAGIRIRRSWPLGAFRPWFSFAGSIESVAQPISGMQRHLNAEHVAGLTCGKASSGRRVLERRDRHLAPSRTTRDEAGFSGVALMAAMALFAAVLMAGIPEGATWTADRHVSVVAEALTNAIRKTQAGRFAAAKGLSPFVRMNDGSALPRLPESPELLGSQVAQWRVLAAAHVDHLDRLGHLEQGEAEPDLTAANDGDPGRRPHGAVVVAWPSRRHGVLAVRQLVLHEADADAHLARMAQTHCARGPDVRLL